MNRLYKVVSVSSHQVQMEVTLRGGKKSTAAVPVTVVEMVPIENPNENSTIKLTLTDEHDFVRGQTRKVEFLKGGK